MDESLMELDDFNYHLPPDFIAQDPIEPRDSSRLLVLDRASGVIRHSIFREIGDYLAPGDLLVFNDTRVLPARLFACKRGSGGKVEILLLRRRELRTWEALVGGKRVRTGTVLDLTGEGESAGAVQAEVTGDLGGSRRVVRFSQPITPRLALFGHTPVPPYIHREPRDPERYQTVYARDPGSAAAPTAGLHFTRELIVRLEERGVRTAFVTLHVGLDTFAPVTERRVEEHAIHAEWIDVPARTAEIVNRARAEGRRVVAVGTTSARALESAAGEAETRNETGLAAYAGDTRLFILPGYRFRVVDAMITNFHLPKSTLLMMVSAFAGRERVLRAYAEAVRSKYRFYSFGDAMLIR
jgi:S-adenosylmethionine:tRNA ribosyltransferase-isomerase